MRILAALLLLVMLVIITANPVAPGVISWPAGPCDIVWRQGQALVGVCAGWELNLTSDALLIRVLILLVIITFVRFGTQFWRRPSF